MGAAGSLLFLLQLQNIQIQYKTRKSISQNLSCYTYGKNQPAASKYMYISIQHTLCTQCLQCIGADYLYTCVCALLDGFCRMYNSKSSVIS